VSDRVRLIVLLALAATARIGAQEPPLQDPMRPPVVPGAQGAATGGGEALALTAVLVSASRRIAVINGGIYRVGDRVNGEEIVAIEPGAVLIRRDGANVPVRIRKSGAVTTTNDGVETR